MEFLGTHQSYYYSALSHFKDAQKHKGRLKSAGSQTFPDRTCSLLEVFEAAVSFLHQMSKKQHLQQAVRRNLSQLNPHNEMDFKSSRFQNSAASLLSTY